MINIKDGRNELYQWDTGRAVTVDAECTQVHFSNKVYGRSIDVDVVDGEAMIPDVLLQADKDLQVWAFVGSAENGYTKISKSFEVHRRNKPADYVFTPTEQTTLQQVLDRLQELEENPFDEEAFEKAIEEYLSENPIEGGTIWTMTGKMTSALNGTASVTLYEDGAVTSKRAYLICYVSSGGAEFREHSRSEGYFYGSKSWSYDGTEDGIAWLCLAFEDSTKTNLLSACFFAVGSNGQDGSDGEDGFSPIVDVEDIDGGHRVTITDKEGEKTFDVMDGQGGEGGDCNAIIDVIELPTDNIREDCFYRLLTGSFVTWLERQNKWVCHCVEALPETGEPAFSGDLSDVSSIVVTAYYLVSDESVNAYVTTELASVFGVPIGWYPVATLMSAVGYTFSGTITDILDDPNDGSFSLLLEYITYDHKNEKWTSHKTIGWSGIGPNAEIFNNPLNVASGGNSHAEGYSTTASGRYQHTQGKYNIDDPDDKYAHIVGNGVSGDRSNAHTIDWDGNAWFSGDVYVGSASGKNKDEGSKKLATEDAVNCKVSLPVDADGSPESGIIGQFAISDGNGGITWQSLTNVGEVGA